MLRQIAWITSLLILPGCSSVEYLWQAGRGQLSIMNRARPLGKAIEDETTPPRIRVLLTEVPRVKSFGEQYGLKPTRNYEEYVKLDRDAVVYVVSACHPLRFEPKEWKFPVVGGFPYLGFYARDGADRYAEKLRAEGFDVNVRGAPAYSTLGWFRDPILSTMIIEGESAPAELAEVVLHESLHATVYVNHQAYFNEALASYVSEGLTPLYLRHSRPSEERLIKLYADSLARSESKFARMHSAYLSLDEVYQSGMSDAEKLAKKAAILEGLRTEIKWRPERSLNNATLLGFREYEGNRESFDRMFEKCGKDWRRFIVALTGIEEKHFPARQTKDLSGVERAFQCAVVTE